MGTAPGTDVMPPLDPAQLAVGDQLYDTRRKLEMTVTALKPCGGCACGHGDISVREDHDDGPRRRTWSFAQFRKLKSLVREPAMGQLRYDDDLGWLIDAHPVRSGDAVLVRARATDTNITFVEARLVGGPGSWVPGTQPWHVEITVGGLVFTAPARGRHVELKPLVHVPLGGP